MNEINWIICVVLLFLIAVSVANNESNETAASNKEENYKVLSRKRRYLIFPDGSSFQLVFCAQNHGYLQVGDIVWFGNTAALAWELPTDPNIYHSLIDAEKQFLKGNRRQDNKHVVYFDEDGKVLAKVPYHKKFIVNPAFAKRSVDSIEESNAVNPISRKEMHEARKNKTFIHELDEMSIKFHRDGRKSLYAKVEKVLQVLGWKGKECLLRLICENSRTRTPDQEQGTFLQEIMTATFSYPKGRKLNEELKDYDVPRSAKEDCKRIYPECEDHGVLFNSNEI